MDRAALLAAMDGLAAEKPRAIHIKGLGDVHIREVTIGEMDAQIADTEDQKDKRKVARGACRLLTDEAGNKLLNPDDPADVDRMAKLPLRVLMAVNKASEIEEKAAAKGN